MATQAAVFVFKGRPCLVLGEAVQQRKPPGYGSYPVVRVRFMDGEQPRLALIPKRQWGTRSHLVRGSQAEYWRRVDDLMEGDGLPAERAKQQAMAEVNKAVGAHC